MQIKLRFYIMPKDMLQQKLQFLRELQLKNLFHSLADSGAPRGGGSKGGCEKLLFSHFVLKNCMKLKELDPKRGRASLAPPWNRQCHYL